MVTAGFVSGSLVSYSFFFNYSNSNEMIAFRSPNPHLDAARRDQAIEEALQLTVSIHVAVALVWAKRRVRVRRTVGFGTGIRVLGST